MTFSDQLFSVVWVTRHKFYPQGEKKIHAPYWSARIFVVLIKKTNFQHGKECWLGL